MTDRAYQAQRITDRGPHAGEADLASGATFLPDDQLVSWWQGWLGRHAHLLGRRRAEQDRQRRGSFVAATMMAWLYADASRPAEIAPDHLDKEAYSQGMLCNVTAMDRARFEA